MTTPTQAQIEAAENTDRELWREREDDYYADSIHVTKDGGIGMNVGGSVIVMPVRKWHALAAAQVGGGIGSFPEDDPRPGAFHAAQVGEPLDNSHMIDALIDERVRAYDEGVAATIERCAQVAETYDMDGGLKDGLPKGWEGCRRMIATAIRKLKDEA